MARKKIPCEFCNGEYESEAKEGRNGFYMWAESYPDNNLLSVICQANDEEGYMQEAHIDFQMNYCPNCGRKLEGY